PRKIGRGFGENIVLDRGGSVRYAHKPENTGFFSNVTTVSPPSAHVGDMRGPFRGQRNHPATGYRPKHHRNGKTA
ncbi:MAG: hypothetical protein WCG29_14010, partial [Desulfomonile sp.]